MRTRPPSHPSPTRVSGPPLAALFMLLAFLAVLALPATGLGASITAHIGGDRTGSNTVAGFTSPVAPVTFEYRTNTGGSSWSDLCTVTAGSQSCSSSAPANTTNYVVRVKDGSQPAGWRALTEISFGGGNADAGPTLAYEAVVRTDNGSSNVTASPNRAPSGTTDQGLTQFHMLARDNPALPRSCGGFNVVMTMDISSSINTAGGGLTGYQKRQGMAAGAKALVDGLAGANVTLRIDTFGSGVSQGATLYNMAVAANRTAAKTQIDAVYQPTNPSPTWTTNYTNWDSALNDANNRNDTGVVVLLTDGNPTRDASTTQDSTVRQRAVSYAIASANTVKAAHKRIIAVGAGAGVTPVNLATVSGPTADDDYFVGDFSELETKLRAIAAQLCGAKVHVQKYVDHATAAPATGWNFTTTATNAGDGLTISGTNGGITTGSPAETVFSIGNLPAAGTRDITIDEVLQSNYTFGNAKCQQGSYPTYASVNGLPQNSRVQNLSVALDQEWYCTYVNRRDPGTLEVVKHLAPAGDPGLFNLSAAGPRPLSATNVGHNGTTGVGGTAVTPGDYTIAETAGTGTDLADYAATSTCYLRGDATRTNLLSGGVVAVASGQNVLCVITNTRGGATVAVTKFVDGHAARDMTLFPMTLTGEPGFDLAHGDTDRFVVDSRRPYTVTEGTVPTGYAFAGIACEVNGAPVGTTSAQSITFTPNSGEVVECTVTNTALPTLTVTKRLTGAGAAGDTTAFGFTVSGLPAFTLAGGDSTTSTMPVGGATVAEGTLPDGYTFTAASCTNGVTTVASGRSMNITLAAGDAVICSFTNNRNDAPTPPVTPEPPVTPTPPVTPVDPPTGGITNVPDVPATVVQPSLAITKAGPAKARGLQRIAYTIRVRNTGTVVAHSVVVTDRLPRSLAFLRASRAASFRSGAVTIALGNMKPGQVKVVRVIVRAAADARGRRVNVAQVRATSVRPVTARAATVFTPLRRQVTPAVTG